MFALRRRIMNKDMLAMALRNYGYGRWEAPYWFIGPAQGMGPHEKGLDRRVKAWLDLGSHELNDCREFHCRIDEIRWHFKKPKVQLQRTWRPLMLSMMTFLDRQEDSESLRIYQRDRWGSLAGETCVIELSGLAARSLKESQETGQFLPERIEHIRDKMRSRRPKLVVMYGKKQKDSWEKIAGCAFPPKPKSFLTVGDTIMAATPHPVSRIFDGSKYLGNEYWETLGMNLRDLCIQTEIDSENHDCGKGA
jgi:hypothetical protein